MSIASAFHSAGSGLTATARLADTVSTNVANALTPGYARRSTELTSLALGGYGGGVRAATTVRAEATLLTAERRQIAAAAAAAATLSSAHDRALAAVGEPGDPTALASRATALETALISATTSPSSSNHLAQAVSAARALVETINAGASEASQMRLDANAEIARQIDTLNEALRAIDALNAKIKASIHHGRDTLSLEDERARQIDRIAEIVPLKTVKRENGEIAVFTASGGALLDGRVWELELEASGNAAGRLLQHRGGLEPAVVPIAAATGAGLMDGGGLSALFEVRDRLAPALGAELDRYAADLVARFADPDLGVPAAALDALGRGLFVDAGAATGIGSVEGLALRLELNRAVDPAAGGDVRRLRDGLDPDAPPRPEGFGAFLQGMKDAMTAPRPAPGGMASTSASLGAASLAAELGAHFGGAAARADEARAYLAAQTAVLAERELGLVGVDTDAELQYLMLVEQAYAANARVLSVIDALLKQLLEI
jgi:flagellar hook-associated protein 1